MIITDGLQVPKSAASFRNVIECPRCKSKKQTLDKTNSYRYVRTYVCKDCNLQFRYDVTPHGFYGELDTDDGAFKGQALELGLHIGKKRIRKGEL